MVFGTCAEEAVREMRFRIEQKTSLTASAGERDAVCSFSSEDTLSESQIAPYLDFN